MFSASCASRGQWGVALGVQGPEVGLGREQEKNDSAGVPRSVHLPGDGRETGVWGGQGVTGPSDVLPSLHPRAGSRWLAAERISKLVLLVVCSKFL